MKKELKLKLEQALLAEGLKKDLFKFVVVNDETEIEGALSELKKLQNQEPKDLDAYLKDNPEQKSEFDRRMTKGIETYIEKQKNQEVPNPKEPKPNEVKDDKYTELLKKVTALETQKLLSEKIDSAKKIWSDSELPEFLFKQLNVTKETTEEEITAQVDALKESFSSYEQQVINKYTGTDGFPNPSSSEEITEEEVEEYIK